MLLSDPPGVPLSRRQPAAESNAKHVAMGELPAQASAGVWPVRACCWMLALGRRKSAGPVEQTSLPRLSWTATSAAGRPGPRGSVGRLASRRRTDARCQFDLSWTEIPISTWPSNADCAGVQGDLPRAPGWAKSRLKSPPPCRGGSKSPPFFRLVRHGVAQAMALLKIAG